MFFGEYRHTIDSKGRIFLPAKMRDELGEKFWVCKGMGKCLQIFTDGEWTKFCESIDTLASAEGRHIKLYFYSGANETCLDAQGRIALSPTHRAFASLDKNVVIIGNRNHLEIWSEAAWEAEQSELDSERVTATLLSMGF